MFMTIKVEAIKDKIRKIDEDSSYVFAKNIIYDKVNYLLKMVVDESV